MNTYESPGEYTLPLSKGSYIFEAWGAQGGSCNIGDYIPSGGFVNYTLSLDYETEVNIYIGGKGTISPERNATTPGGYNGGGASSYGRVFGTNPIVNGGSGGGSSFVFTSNSEIPEGNITEHNSNYDYIDEKPYAFQKETDYK